MSFKPNALNTVYSKHFLTSISYKKPEVDLKLSYKGRGPNMTV